MAGEESRINSVSIANGDRPEMFRFAQRDNGIYRFGSQMLPAMGNGIRQLTS
jgi:hypothetical protein